MNQFFVITIVLCVKILPICVCLLLVLCAILF